ncbi:MAG: SUMF1/EgtB/PvdO family nonheme iron enzyme [Nannocystaceae bacterium]
MAREDDPPTDARPTAAAIIAEVLDVEGDLVAGDKHVHFHGPPPEPAGPSTHASAVAPYLAWCDQRPYDLKLHGVGGGDIRLGLDEVYVPLAYHRLERGQTADTDTTRDFGIASLFTQLAPCRHALVLGDPGTGKTTAMRKLSQLCRREALAIESEAIPVLVPLRHVRPRDLDAPLTALLRRVLVELSEGALDEEALSGLTAHRALVVLLDGLDEIVDPRLRAKFCGYLCAQLFTNACEHYRVVVSCRFSGYDGRRVRLDDRFAPVEIRPLSATQARMLVHRWFNEASDQIPRYEKREATRNAEDLLAALESPKFSHRGKVMFSTPLLLTLLCVVVQRGHRMPDSRGVFYDRCLRVLLEQWHLAKGEAVDIDADTALAILRPIAYRLHADARREELDREELTCAIGDRLVDLGRADMDEDALLDWLEHRAGVLSELAPGQLGFFHLGVQEYLTALHIAHEGDAAIRALASEFDKTWWHEVARLLVSLPGRRVFAPLIAALIDGPALLQPELWDVIRSCFVEAAEVDLEPVLDRLGQRSTSSRRLRALLRLVKGHYDPRLAKAAIRLAARTRDLQVRALAEGVAADAMVRLEVEGSQRELRYDVAVLGGPEDRDSVQGLARRLASFGLSIWPGRELLPTLEQVDRRVVKAQARAVVVVARDAAPWQTYSAMLMNLGRACTREGRPLLGVLAPGAAVERADAPPEIAAWIDMSGGWEDPRLASLCRWIREAPAGSRPFAGPKDGADVSARAGPVWIEPRTGIRFLWIPGGRLLMGSDELSERERPVHEVTVSPFWIGEVPVTNQQYAVFLGDRGHDEPVFWRERRFSDPQQPVVGVRWDDAVAFCAWLREVTGRAIALPSEAQWEFAARGPESRRFPWGDAPVFDKSRACFSRGRSGKPAVVGSYPKGRGPFGTLDQAGGVWEWCCDVWDSRAYSKRTSQRGVIDPVVRRGDPDNRVVRGGSWRDEDSSVLHSAYRAGYWRGSGVFDFGFRVLMAANDSLR